MSESDNMKKEASHEMWLFVLHISRKWQLTLTEL